MSIQPSLEKTFHEERARALKEKAWVFPDGRPAPVAPATGAAPDSGALRFNSGKPRMSLLPQDALIEVAKVLTKGLEKYEAHNWRKGFPYSTILDSLHRHLAAFAQGEDYDAETGELHMAHAACNVLFLIAQQVAKTGTDDRYMR